MKRVLIVAGDHSGDLIASQLVASLRKLGGDIHVTAVGGQELQRVADTFLKNIVDRGAFGAVYTPRTIAFFRDVLNDVIIREIETNSPEAVIPVDFYGFNSRVAKAAKTRGRKVFYYASPQFWATRSYRADNLRPYVDLFLCLFPFEIDFYRKRKIAATFVGHPIIDVLPAPDDRPARIEATVGLLPGSRVGEIRRHLPVIVDACDRITAAAPGTRFVLFMVRHVPRQFYQDILAAAAKPSKSLIELVQDDDYVWRTQIDLAITASGMETLENALLGIPMVIMYKTNWITYRIAKAIIHVPHLGMPNLLAGKLIVPEFIQGEATAANISGPIIEWIRNPAEARRLRKELLALREKFGEHGASDRAARVILEKVA